MKILIHLANAGEGEISKDFPREQNIRNLFETVNNLYEASTSDSSCWLYEQDVSDINCVFGFDEPEHIILEAEKWNGEIVRHFHLALAALDAEKERTGKLPMDNTLTYDLKKAVTALDGCFHEFAETAVALKPACDYFTSLIEPKQLQDIKEHPENYATIIVWPK